jgi:hypothetical protein
MAMGTVTVQTIKRDIKPNEKLEFDGPTRIEGNIGKDAQVTVNDGGLVVTGSVADGVKLVNKDSTTGETRIDTSGNGQIGSVTIRQMGKDNIPTMVDGQPAGAAPSQNQTAGITLDGQVGDDVNLESTSSITLTKDAGAGLKAKAGNTFKAVNVGEGAYVRADNIIELMILAALSEMRAGNTIIVHRISDYSIVNAGNSVRASSVGQGATVEAGNTVTADTADRSAHMKAGNKVDVKQYKDSDTIFQDQKVGGSSTAPTGQRSSLTARPHQQGSRGSSTPRMG